MRQPTIFLFCFFALISCKEETTEPLEEMFVLRVPADYPTNNTDNWVMLHDLNGSLLDHKSFESGDTMVFQFTNSEITDQFIVTLFEYLQENGFTYYNLNSYSAIAQKQEWELTTSQKPTSTINNTIIGNFTLTVTDASQIFTKSLTARSGRWSSWPIQNVATQNIYEGDSSFLLSVETDLGNPRYKFLENVTDQGSYEVSFINEMSEFDKKIDVTFPPTKDILLIITGYEKDQPMNGFGYELYNNLLFPNTVTRSSISLGFLNRFDRYSTSLKVGYSGLEYIYSKKGSIPTSISLPLHMEFELIDKSLGNYSYTYSEGFSMRKTRYFHKDINNSYSINWDVFAPPIDTRIKELPDNFANLYPQFQLDKPVHYVTDFYVQHNVSYNDFIDINFKGKKSVQTDDIYIISLK